MINKMNKNLDRRKRQLRVRSKISGTPTCPRLNIYKSTSQIYAQIIDDVTGTTLVSASTLDKDLNIASTGNVEAAKAVGAAVAKRASEKNITAVNNARKIIYNINAKYRSIKTNKEKIRMSRATF